LLRLELEVIGKPWHSAVNVVFGIVHVASVVADTL
jgi:hypothetical protein